MYLFQRFRTILRAFFHHYTKFFVAAILANHIGVASAMIVLDRSPDFSGGAILIENLLNVEGQTLNQWNVERFTLGTNASIDAVDIYSNSYGLNKVGNDVVVRIWSSTNNQPQTLLYKTLTHVTIQDSEGSFTSPNLTRKFAELQTPFLADASVQYWISITGSVDNLGMATYVNVDDGSTWLGRTGDYPSAECSFCGDMVFRLHSEFTSPIPEPNSAILALLGCVVLPLVIGASSRRRSKY